MATFQKPKFEKQAVVLSCDHELPEHEQTKWYVVPLSVEQVTECSDMLARGNLPSASRIAFRYGCCGWENLFVDGEPLVFRGQKYPRIADNHLRLTPEELSLIPAEWQFEIGKDILEMSLLTDKEKN